MARGLAVVAALALAACGGGKKAPEAEVQQQEAVSWCKSFFDTQAARSVVACAQGSAAYAEALKADAVVLCEVAIPSLLQDAGFDKAQAELCLAALAALPCDAWAGASDPLVAADGVPSCQGVLRGRVPVGGACDADIDCAGGWCAIGSSCPGQCRARTPDGQACGTGTRCEMGRACAFREGGPICVARGADGDACPCKASLYCDQTVCRSRKAVGGSCAVAGSYECAWGLACTGTPPTCQRAVGPAGSCAAGEPCAVGTWCAAGTCTDLPGVGQPCADGGCRRGYCDAQQVCRTLRLPGESCTSAKECLTWCDGSTGKCGPFDLCRM